MAICEFSTSCSFLTKEVVNFPKTSRFIRDKYCDGEFSTCVLFNSFKSAALDNAPEKSPPIGMKNPKWWCGTLSLISLRQLDCIFNWADRPFSNLYQFRLTSRHHTTPPQRPAQQNHSGYSFSFFSPEIGDSLSRPVSRTSTTALHFRLMMPVYLAVCLRAWRAPEGGVLSQVIGANWNRHRPDRSRSGSNRHSVEHGCCLSRRIGACGLPLYFVYLA